MKIVTVTGTRPEFIRLSLVFRELTAAGIENFLVHTGQNYDPLLSDIFFEELSLPAPDAYLDVRAGSVGEQIGHIVARVEPVILEQQPDALLILGDTNSSLAAIAGARHNVPVFHMEAGNRCFDSACPRGKEPQADRPHQRLAASVHASFARIPPRGGDRADEDPCVRKSDR